MRDLRNSMWKSFDEGSVTCYKCVGRLTAGFLIRITDMFGIGHWLTRSEIGKGKKCHVCGEVITGGKK